MPLSDLEKMDAKILLDIGSKALAALRALHVQVWSDTGR
jgi:hypothetical protein